MSTSSMFPLPEPTHEDLRAHQQGPHSLSHGPLLLFQASDLFPQLPQLLPRRDLGVDRAGKDMKQPLSFASSGWRLIPPATWTGSGKAETPHCPLVTGPRSFPSVLSPLMFLFLSPLDWTSDPEES